MQGGDVSARRQLPLTAQHLQGWGLREQNVAFAKVGWIQTVST
jgi:hypothetical protein